jgi:ABC-type multidrug transport system fused ATPase/permease subunit
MMEEERNAANEPEPRAGEKGGSVQMKDYTASWTSGGETVLKNINLEAKSGDLIAIVGPVGSGKVGSNWISEIAGLL